jgi:hypothetical protein
MIIDSELHKAVSTRRAHGRYEIYDEAKEIIGNVWYFKDDSSLPNNQYYCSWEKAEIVEVEIYDPKEEGKWRYSATFPKSVLGNKIKRMSSWLALTVWNYTVDVLDNKYIEY